MNVPELQISEWPWNHIWRVKIPYKVACFTWLLANEAALTHERKCDKERNNFMVTVLGIMLRLLVIYFYPAKSQISHGGFLSISKASRGQCLERLLILYLAGRKLELGQGIETNGGSIPPLYGGLSGKKEM